jgi:hypothetical protein
MRRHVYEVVVLTTPEVLWSAIADVRRWPDWDAELENTRVTGTIVPGSRFTLKPRGGPVVKMSVEAMEASRRFVDVAHLPLAKMRVSHEFERQPAGTRIRITIEVRGVLAFLWDRLVARKLAEGSAVQMQAFVRFAERLS